MTLFEPSADNWIPEDGYRLALRGQGHKTVVSRRINVVMRDELAAFRAAEAERRARIAERKLPAMRIIYECAIEAGTEPDEMWSARRAPKVVAARQKAMYRLRHELRLSFPRIGRFFNRNHTTVIHGVGVHALRYGLPAPAASLRMVLRKRRAA